MIRNRAVTYLFYFLIILFGFVQLFVSTSCLTLLPSSFYYVYENSVESVVQQGNIGELSKIFDNFASSPGTIILLGSLNAVTGLNVNTLLNLLGISYEVVYFTLIWLFMKVLYNDLNPGLAFASIISSGALAIAQPTFSYGSDAYVMLILLMVFLTKILKNGGPRYSSAILMVILAISMLIKYLPMGLFLLVLIILAVVILRIIGALRMRFIMISTVVATIVLAYFAYLGVFFYADFRSFIYSIIRYLEFETIMNVQAVVARRIQSDAFYHILYLMSLLRFSVFIPLAFYPILLLLYNKKNWEMFPADVMLINMLGSILYVAGFTLYVFVSSFTDYGTRILSLGLTFYITTAYSILIIIRSTAILNSWNNALRLLFKFFNFIIIILIFIASIGSIMTPISRIYFELRGLDLSTQYKYGYEALFTSTFISKFARSGDYMNKDIIATYRYIYLYSRYSINYYDLRYVNLKKLQGIDAIIILPMKITIIPDSGFGPLPEEFVQALLYNRNILFNSAISVVLI